MRPTIDIAVGDGRPPRPLVGLANLIMRPLLRTPVGRLITHLALVEFTGRRSAKRYRVVVGWHHIGATPVVLTPASWRVNFAGGHPATAIWRGRRIDLVGTLETDPARAATTVRTLIGTGTSPRLLGLRIPSGHPIDHIDFSAANRAVIQFEPSS